MTTFDAGGVTLERLRENVWEIPQSGGMRVPARVLASERLLEEIGQDKSLAQLRDTAHLPGIQKYALAMPDAHQGYGFPVGGVAGIDAEDGCISPGAVGYDINCLPGDAEVRLSFGRRLPIGELRDRFEDERAVVAGDELVASPVRLFADSGTKPVHEVETETGERIEATADHPFLTPDGMVELADLEPGDAVLVQPFRGLEHEPPADVTVLTEADVAEDDGQALSSKGLLPLSTADEAFNRLLRVLGFFTGCGAFGGEGETRFSGDADTLEGVREDVHELGFDPSEIRAAGDGRARFETNSTAFRTLLEELGAPEDGSGVETPRYVEALASWQKALYYAAYFGAEMDAPAGGNAGLEPPAISRTHTAETVEAGRSFLADTAAFLAEVGVDTTRSAERDDSTAAGTVRLRLEIESDPENLRTFLSTVGYRYDREKRRAAVAAIQYLKATDGERGAGERADAGAPALADGGKQRPKAPDSGRSGEQERLGDRRRSEMSSEPNLSRGFGEFRASLSVRDTLTVETTVASIAESGEKPVYDIGVEHDAHNFLAEGFVVSNCGVRMVRTNLTDDDLRGREEELADRLFEAVPTGLGGGGAIDVSGGEMEAILEDGVEWAVENGYGVPADLAHCEDEGRRPEGDAGAVSKKARDRGLNQVGSLGSGNHFLEVQRVTDIYRPEVAAEFGLSAGQIVVLIHCGSRGLGHQVCTDYLREIERTHGDLLEELPSKELAAAPAGSQLADRYYRAMAAAINFAWVNRQLLTHQTRRVFADVFDRSWADMEMELLYDVAHNIAKRETHTVDGRDRELFVHRKGATRAFPAGRPELPPAYRDVGQPVIIPGSMGAGSYVLRGGERSLAETFGSTAHGAGRLMSRTQAKDEYWGEDVRDALERDRIYVKAESGATIAEEAPGVYKDVDEVVRVSDALGIGDRVARTYPVCNIKG